MPPLSIAFDRCSPILVFDKIQSTHDPGIRRCWSQMKAPGSRGRVIRRRSWRRVVNLCSSCRAPEAGAEVTMLMASPRRGRARHEGCDKRLVLALTKDAGRRRTRVVWLACLVLGWT